jgi:hypothetical protein
MSSAEAMWAELGPISKFTLITTFACTAGFSFGLINPMLLVVNLSDLVWKLQVWRIVTASIFLGKFSFGWLFGVAMLVMYVKRHEEDDFVGRKADMIWMITIIVAALHVAAFVFDMMLLSSAFTLALVWVWCRRHEDAQLSLYGFSFKAGIFPWVLVLFHICLGQSPFDDLVGILCGHMYYFLADIFPKTHNKHWVNTPQWLYNLVPNQRMGAYGVHTAAAARGPVQGAAVPRRDWGAGRALGAGN